MDGGEGRGRERERFVENEKGVFISLGRSVASEGVCVCVCESEHVREWERGRRGSRKAGSDVDSQWREREKRE